MFGLILKSQVQNEINKAVRVARLETAKEYRTILRKKENRIRRLEKYVHKIQNGYIIYKENQEQYIEGVDGIEDGVIQFQNDINSAIGRFRGNLDNKRYKALQDRIKDKKIVKLIS